MTLQTTTVQGILRDPLGNPFAGAKLKFQLSTRAADVNANTALLSVPVEVTSAPDGNVTIDLWPNANGLENSHYVVTAEATIDGKSHTFDYGKVQVPVAGPVELGTLLSLPVAEDLGVSEQTMAAAAEAKAAAAAAAASAASVDMPALQMQVDAFTNGAKALFPVAPNLMDDTSKFDHICGGQKNVAQDLISAVSGPWAALRSGSDVVATATVVPYADFGAAGIPTGGGLAEMEGVDPSDVGFCALLLDVTLPVGGGEFKISQTYARALAQGFGETVAETSVFAAVLEATGSAELTFGMNHASVDVNASDHGQGWKHFHAVSTSGSRYGEFRNSFRGEGRLKLALALPYLGLGDHGGAKIWAGFVGQYHTGDVA